MYICYCPLRDPNWNKYCIVLYCISIFFMDKNVIDKTKLTPFKFIVLLLKCHEIFYLQSALIEIFDKQ